MLVYSIGSSGSVEALPFLKGDDVPQAIQEEKGHSHHRESHGHSYDSQRELLLGRLRKIEGQARGIARMVEEDRYCLDIVQQLSALSAAADEVSLLVLQGHIEGCVADAIREQRGEAAIQELMGVLRKAMRR